MGSELTDTHIALAKLLSRLQAGLQAQQLWASTPPSQAALSSTQPFCVDTLSFEQWLQFVMIVRFRGMIQTSMPLPGNSDMAAMATEAFKGRSLPAVVAIIRAIDELLSGPPPASTNKLTR
ncbi:MAG: YqcC family protein [Bermanella sp.]